jgi:hypothetical protein
VSVSSGKEQYGGTSDIEKFRGIIRGECDVVNLYRYLIYQLAGGTSIATYASLFEDKILGYANIGVDKACDWLFGKDVVELRLHGGAAGLRIDLVDEHQG